MAPFSWAVVALIAAISVAAQEEVCRGNYTLDGAWYADTDYLDCTTIDGNIALGENWSGDDLSLPNAINITGTITIRDLGPSGRCCHSWMGGISAPALEHLGALVVDDTQTGSVTMPRLKTVGTISIVLPDQGWVNFTFPALEEADEIYIGNRFDSVNLDSLRKVANRLVIENDAVSLYPSTAPVSISSLESAGALRLEGYIANLSWPELTTVGPPASPGSESGLLFNLFNGTDVSLPKLKAVDSQVSISGNMTSLSMPALLNTTTPITIAPSVNLDIYLPIVNATSIDLHGYIESANLTNLRQYTSMNLTTKTNLQCEQFTNDFFYLKHNFPAVENSTYTCKSTPPPRFSPKQTLALGLGLGIPLSIIAAAVVWWVVTRNDRVKKRKAVDAGLRVDELSNVMPARREPDGLSPREGHGPVVGGTAGHGHGHEPGPRPETPPPPYSVS
ncbi:uncharacterized protein BDV14DRAFT_173562 [Aspergillus stella-maris]|uniref:uncharacterized protein n=1 Tax=Aspergillus stella-maris TaxID=1810926 RepID=UPI003CCCFACF